MLFNSINFVIFLPLVVILFYAIPQRWRWILLLLASYYFYMSWRVEYAALLLTSTLVDYFAAIQMEKQTQKKKKRKFLILSLIVNLSMLVFFKYYNFVGENMNLVFGSVNLFIQIPELKILLPVGISFYTFQTIGYSIDVYRGHIKAEKHMGIFALYVSFFPQLVAGPIERSRNLLPQFRQKFEFSYDLFTSGIKLMLWGFFKKVVIADRLGFFVANVYDDPSKFHGLPVFLATIMFFFQLYCDFSGYSDIAIGSARTMGYKLMKNFDRPYIARSFSEFWNRWHISLNTWFRDYLLFYMPFGKNKKLIRFRIHLNLFIVVMIIGLWHGAKWTYIAWGTLMAIYMTGESMTKKLRMRFEQISRINQHPLLHKYFDIMIVFLLIALSPILFRANAASDISLLIQSAFDFSNFELVFMRMIKYQFISNSLLIVFLLIIENYHAHYNLNLTLAAKPIVIRWSVYIIFLVSILFLGIFNQEQFIYFQF